MVTIRDSKGRFIKGQIPDTCFKKGNIGYWTGKKRSEEDKLKMSLGKKGKSYPLMSECKKGRKLSEKTKKRMSESAIKHMKECGRTSLTPNIGVFEKTFLNVLEHQIGFKILRQHSISSFFVDGYCPEINLVIEINETYHHKRKKSYDSRREKEIINILNCQFLNFDVSKEVKI